MALAKATLRGDSGTQIVLEFANDQIAIEGECLFELFAHILSGRTRVIRKGTSACGSIRVIHIMDT